MTFAMRIVEIASIAVLVFFMKIVQAYGIETPSSTQVTGAIIVIGQDHHQQFYSDKHYLLLLTPTRYISTTHYICIALSALSASSFAVVPPY